MLTIDIDIARRFILGKQGLWPGRRWRGIEGTEQAMREMEYLQLDPLQIIARSQDIKLHSRVIDYKPGMWEEVTYQQRKFFDWGGWLAVRPMEELPYWRVVMRRERDSNERIRSMAAEHADAIVEMREVLRERGTVSNRDFTMAARKRTENYRGRKDSALALYYLWRTGEVMTHHRENFERVYALTDAVAPAHLIRESEEDEADRFLIKKEISFSGLARLNVTSDSFLRGSPTNKAKIFEAMMADGEIIEVRVEGWKAVHYALGTDAPLLHELSAGRVPSAWTPLGTTTTDEVLFLAPLDQVSARGRAKVLFGFDYVWEVYKPEHQRKFGYYTLPILWGDRLVGRFDSKLDRATNTFVILGFWLEEGALGTDEAFAEALARGFARFGTFLGASKLEASAIGEPLLHRRVCAMSYVWAGGGSTMTAQIHELLIFDGEETSMAFCPPLPEEHPRIMKVEPEEALQDGESGILFSTACWRGYQGSWEIRDGRFYLVGLRGQYRLLGRGPVLADWFSGVLRIPKGEVLQYVHMGFGSVHEQEVHVKVEQGVVISSRVIDNRGKKHDPRVLGLRNLPGGENRFPGDDEL